MNKVSRELTLGARRHRQATLTLSEEDDGDDDDMIAQLIALEDALTAEMLVSHATERGTAVLAAHGKIDRPDIEPQDDEELLLNPPAFWARCLLKQARYLDFAASRVQAAFPLPPQPEPSANAGTLRAFNSAIHAAMLIGRHLGRLEEISGTLKSGKTMDKVVIATLSEKAAEVSGGKKSGKKRRQHYSELLAAAVGLRAANACATDDWIARTLFEKLKKPSPERIARLLRVWRAEGLLPYKTPKPRRTTSKPARRASRPIPPN